MRSVAISLALFALPLVASVAIRVRVYGQLLPNTFYTKTDTGYGVDSGLDYLRDTSLAYGLHWVLVAAVLVIVVPVVAGRTPPTNPAWRCRVWFLAASAAMTAYTVAVGGDFMHARFLLTSVVLLMAVFAGLGSRAVASLGTDHGRRAALAAVATILVVAATRSTEPVQRALTQPDATRGAVFGDVADEAYSYLYRNPALHDWDQSTHDRWTYRGRAARGLAERLDTEIGIVSGGIGQITFAGQANGGRVYVYDLLGLTRPDIARLDMLGTERRVGHAKRAPDVLIAANPRVDFHDLYFPGWRDAAFVRYDDRGFVLANLDLIDPLVERGVILPEDATRIRRWILDQLSGPTIDRNFVTFVTMRYHRDDEILERVRELGDLDRASAWRRWLDATAEERALLEPTGCSGLSTTDCWRRAIDRQRAAPFPTLPNGPDPVEVEPVEMEPVEVEPG